MVVYVETPRKPSIYGRMVADRRVELNAMLDAMKIDRSNIVDGEVPHCMMSQRKTSHAVRLRAVRLTADAMDEKISKLTEVYRQS